MAGAMVVAASIAAAGMGACGGSGAAPADGGGGASGSGGAGGSAVMACPAALPVSGAACAGAPTCFYEDCEVTGRSVARCTNGAWTVETGACTGVYCLSQTCAPGQLCLMSGGGALLVQCIDNGCGSAAIACGCLQSCAGNCTVGGSLSSGVTIQCNTCPSNQCA
jgi:hypothetical protein